SPPVLCVATGRAYEAIVRTADAVGADLLVLGRRGETDLADLLLGSTAQRVVGLAQRAVLLVQA
ncbi:MAG TPA: universal stress protein, partial [Burkholderiaceae bacterium]|nr:universal stress protein [Burkholderiaceae bacterium]